MTAPGAEPTVAGDPGFGTPPGPPTGRSWKPDVPSSRDVLSALVVTFSLVIVGVPLGLLWGWTTPTLNVQMALRSSSGVISESAFNAQAGVDVHFALLALIFGLIAGALVGWRSRASSWPLPLSLAVGSLAGSLVAAQIGHVQKSSRVLDQIPENIRGQVGGLADFVLRSQGFHVVFPVAALIMYLAIVLVTTGHEAPQLPSDPELDRYWSVPR